MTSNKDGKPEDQVKSWHCSNKTGTGSRKPTGFCPTPCGTQAQPRAVLPSSDLGWHQFFVFCFFKNPSKNYKIILITECIYSYMFYNLFLILTCQINIILEIEFLTILHIYFLKNLNYISAFVRRLFKVQNVISFQGKLPLFLRLIFHICFQFPVT